jgi:hypothetical protein
MAGTIEADLPGNFHHRLWGGVQKGFGLVQAQWQLVLIRRKASVLLESVPQRGVADVQALPITAFQLMRELRAGDRFLDRHRAAWLQWSPSTAQFALQELRAVTDFVDTLRALALKPPAPRPHDIEAN